MDTEDMSARFEGLCATAPEDRSPTRQESRQAEVAAPLLVPCEHPRDYTYHIDQIEQSADNHRPDIPTARRARIRFGSGEITGVILAVHPCRVHDGHDATYQAAKHSRDDRPNEVVLRFGRSIRSTQRRSALSTIDLAFDIIGTTA